MKRIIKGIIKILTLLIIAVSVYGCIVGDNCEIIQSINCYLEDISVKPDRDVSIVEEKKNICVEEFKSNLSPDDIKSEYAILINLNKQQVLYEKNADEKMYPASLTKIMTALVVIERMPDLKKKIKLTNQAFENLYESNASLAGFTPGEYVEGIDLLYGLMLPSGAECSQGLALECAENIEEFVDLMNQRAKEIGMYQTHFENVTGLHDNNHYTTVHELGLLLKTALMNDTFLEIYTTSSHKTIGDNVYTDGLNMKSTFLVDEDAIQIDNGNIIGGKTGYTEEAGLCLSSLAIIRDEAYIFISAGAQGNHNTEQYNVLDAVRAYNSIEVKK